VRDRVFDVGDGHRHAIDVASLVSNDM
jgi:hypothetical protein